MSANKCAKCGMGKSGGHVSYCRLCYNEYKREWYSRNRESEARRASEYNKKNQHVARNSMRRYRERNPDRARRNFKEWRAANKDRVALYDHNKKVKRRAAIGVDKVTLAEWREIKEKHQPRCAYCGEKRPLTMDHVVPLSKGGRHIAENIAPACKLCNSRKTNMSVIDFAQEKLGKLL